MPDIAVLDSTMHYEEQGSGTPIVFLHGNPVSSHVWRKVLPLIDGPGRLLAPDLIGMGRSGKPDIGYKFDDHARYLDAWFDALGLDEVILVGLDWGGALGFDRAARHPERVRGVAFMETILRPMTWAEYPESARERFRAFRTPAGEKLVLEQNIFIEDAIKRTILTGLSDEDHDVYRAPYPTPESRRPLLEWPRAMPIDGEPADVVARIEAYDKWLATSDDVPKLLLTFDGSPALLVGPELIGWCEENISDLEIVACGAAAHLAPEDRPAEIAAALTRWADERGLRTTNTVPHA
ncbi:haloalkane dehalogenase [Amycolatopsis sp. lyj-112]|uniref:haloalkane dehalogenase n=1 Tax=Amycolatopsis sp. lyj-112 TaxID=2789288 RepID=UPI00397B062F